MSFTFLSNDLLQMDIISLTLRAPWILTLNALKAFENHKVSGILLPIHSQNPLAQNR